MKIVLWGSGGHGGVVLDAVYCQGVHEAVAFIDDRQGGAARRQGLPVFDRSHLRKLREEGVAGLVVAVGNERTRAALAEAALLAGFQLCTVAHPSAVICDDVKIGRGTVVCAGCIVQSGAQIGSNVIVNTGAIVDHDCTIHDTAQLAPRVVLGGRVAIGELTFVGIGTTVSDRITIGRNCVIGAGAVVVHDVPDDSVAYGVPAKVIRQRRHE